MDRVYKRYLFDASCSVPGRTRRRHKRIQEQEILKAMGVVHKRPVSTSEQPQSANDGSLSEADESNCSAQVFFESPEEILSCSANDSDTTENVSVASGLACSYYSDSSSESEVLPDDSVSIEGSPSDSVMFESLQHSSGSSSDSDVLCCEVEESDTGDEESLGMSDGADSEHGSFQHDDDAVWQGDVFCAPMGQPRCVPIHLQNEFGELRQKLCPCSEVTQGEALLSVLSLGLRHGLSYKAMVDILKMLNVLYQREVVPATFYSLLKHAEPNRSKDHIHPICPKCTNYIGDAHDKEHLQCTCGHVLEYPLKVKNFTMTLGMRDQIKALLEKTGVAENLNYRFEREKVCVDSIEDVYDGELYRDLSAPGKPLHDRNNLSYSFNTDGVAFGSSSTQQLWPIYIIINELPPTMRAQNMLLVGLWVGKSEPNMLVILQPFVNEANQLSTEGVDWTRDGVVVNSKVIPLFSVVDTQARWRLLNHKCFSGDYGCTFCESRGQHTKRGWRYSVLNTTPLDRTDKSLRDCMYQGYCRRNLPNKKYRHFKGSRGPSVLINLHYFNLSSGLPPDSMHMLKGCVQQNLELILRKLEDEEIDLISQRLSLLQPPSVLSRLPRGLKEREKYKANEFRAFLIFYGPVVMQGVVASKYLSHFCLLSGAMYLLMQKSITKAQLRFAAKLLVLYVMLYEQYYGIEYMTYNIHLLLHVGKSVNNLGPLWTHTCYPFEGKNRYLLQLAKSPLEVGKGVARRYAIFNNLPQLCDRFNVSDEVLNFCNSLFFRPLRVAIRCDGVVLLGRGQSYVLSNEEREVLREQQGVTSLESVFQFQRFQLDGLRYTAKDYNVHFRRDDSGIYHTKSGRQNKCRIINIVLIGGEAGVIIFAQEMLEETRPLWVVKGFPVKHTTKITGIGRLLALRPDEIGGQCVFMTTDAGTFATCFPYGCKGD